MNVIDPATQVSTALDVIRFVFDCCQPREPETVWYENCLGRTLREEIYAPEDQPVFDRSAVDGYAVRVDSTESTFAVVDRIRAGEWKPRSVEPGQAVQIATGAALPCPGLQVVMKEDVQLEGNLIRVTRRYNELNVRFRGADTRKGKLLIKSGVVLTPGALVLLAGVGRVRTAVTRLPRVIHAATGNEIVSPEKTPSPGQIRDTNSILIRSFFKQWNIDVEQLRVPEEESAIQSQLKPEFVANSDILLISGGASVGEHDFTRRILEQLGFSIQICKTNTRPGKPLIFGTRGRSIAFGLPGNPLAHFVCLNLYVRAALEKMLARPTRCVPLSAELAANLEDISNPRETLWPAQVESTATGPILIPLRWSSSGDLTCLAAANGLTRIPAHCDRIAAGTQVEYFPVGVPNESLS